MGDLFVQTANEAATLGFYQHVGLLSLVKVCDCGNNMELKNWNGCIIDGKHWQCTHQPCREYFLLACTYLFKNECTLCTFIQLAI